MHVSKSSSGDGPGKQYAYIGPFVCLDPSTLHCLSTYSTASTSELYRLDSTASSTLDLSTYYTLSGLIRLFDLLNGSTQDACVVRRATI